MTTFLIDLTMRLLARLPLGMNQAIGRSIGRLAWATNSSARKITSTNLALCFPDMPPKERTALAKQSLLHTGMLLSESAWVWYRPTNEVKEKVSDTVGQELLDAAASSKNGIIFASPHLGNWEVSNLIVSEQLELHYFYRSPRNPILQPLLLKWRSELGGIALELTSTGIRDAMRVLKSGGAVGILPDQEPDTANGIFAPFMGTPALTMTLLSRLANKTNSTVGVAECLATIPAQYLWDYKRFNTLEGGERRNYKNPAVTSPLDQ